jgi:SAM-dependent methyltransferase
MSERQKRQESEFDAYSETYSSAVNRSIAFSGLSVDFFARVKADYLVDIMKKLHSRSALAELLDLGCGVGNYHSLLTGRVGRIEGVDVSEACIAVARRFHPAVKYSLFDGLHLPHADNIFDVVYTVCVLHHVPVATRPGLVREAWRVLRPGGLFVIFEHNPVNPLTHYAVSNCEFDKDAILLSRHQSETLMNDSGFREVTSRFILTIPAAGSILRRIDRLFSRIPIGAQYYTVGRR